jgi:hypothetical protein
MMLGIFRVVPSSIELVSRLITVVLLSYYIAAYCCKSLASNVIDMSYMQHCLKLFLKS